VCVSSKVSPREREKREREEKTRERGEREGKKKEGRRKKERFVSLFLPSLSLRCESLQVSCQPAAQLIVKQRKLMKVDHSKFEN